MVAGDEARRHNLIASLSSLNVPAMSAIHLPFDYMWTVDDEKPRVIAGERKSITDFIASYTDERLHHQVKAMVDMDAWLKFLLIEGQWSRDGSLVGDKDHSWTWDQFDNAILSIQCEGVEVVHSFSEPMTARRLASLWRWSTNDEHGSWHMPAPVFPATDPEHPIFDNTFRSHVGAVMHTPNVGMKTAYDLCTQFPFMEVLGITESGIAIAKERWTSVKGIGKKTFEGYEAWVRA